MIASAYFKEAQHPWKEVQVASRNNEGTTQIYGS